MSKANANSKKGRSEKRTREILDKNLERDFNEIRDGSRKVVSKVCQNYLKAIVDTRNAPKVGVPTLAGGMPGKTAIVRFTNQIEVTVGTGGIGFISVAPVSHRVSTHSNGGPFSDSNIMTSTGPTYSGTTIPSAGASLPVGVFVGGWVQSPYKLGGVQTDLQYRLVGLTMSIFPDSSFMDQNGRIAILEAPGHQPLNFVVSQPLSTLESYPGVRVVRGTQTGAQSEKINLNWHPMSGASTAATSAGGENFNDFDFVDHRLVPAAGSITPVMDGLMIACFGKAGTQFHVELTGMYEMRGKSIPGVKPRLVDSRGMDLISNVIASKLISGYVGKPEHVYESYLAKAWGAAKSSASWVSTHNKELMEGAGRALDMIGGFA